MLANEIERQSWCFIRIRENLAPDYSNHFRPKFMPQYKHAHTC